MPGLPSKVEKLWKNRAKPTGVPSRQANTTSAYGRGPKSEAARSAVVADISCSRRSYTASSRMNSSTSGSSCAAAGRMVTVSAIASTGALQPLRDAADAREQRREQLAVLAAAGAPALQQVHLHEVHGIDVGVAQADGALHGRIVVVRDIEVGARQHGLEVIEEIAEEEPGGERFAHACQAELLHYGREPAAG